MVPANITTALAHSFIFHSRRAERICNECKNIFELPRDIRKNFIDNLKPLIAVRNTNEHGFDRKETKGNRPKPYKHVIDNLNYMVDETSLIIRSDKEILKGPLNLYDVYISVNAMRRIAGYSSLPSKISIPGINT